MWDSRGPAIPDDPLDSPAPRPAPQYLAPELVLDEMSEHGARRVGALTVPRVLVLAVLAGGFITLGALFSLLLGAGTDGEGTLRLLEGLGFSAGFFFVILSGAVLFTEVNVVLPATLLMTRARLAALVVRFWTLAWLGNLLGALVTGYLVHVAQEYSPAVEELLGELVAAKMSYRDAGGVDGWARAVLSGILANWIVGMAAFFAVMGRTIVGKYIPVFLAVTLFVSANFQHSPANMGFFSLIMPTGDGPGWGPAIGWNIVPAGIGNIIGGTLLVALPFWYVGTRAHRAAARDRTSAG